MDLVLDMTRELAEALQQDERYIKMQMAQAAADEDESLQALIGEFNLKRIAVNTETTKDEGERDGERIRQLDTELRAVYAELMANEHMKAYQSAKEEFDLLMNKMTRVLTLAAQGEDPYEIDTEAGCAGNCASCGGCH